MLKPTIPHNEKARQAALDATGLVGSAPEERFDRYTRLARRLFDVPTALISLVDRHRQWFKSIRGLEATETPRDVSFCGHAINADGLFVIENAIKDERFHDNPLVTDDPNIRFYAGCPIRTPDGHKIGTLCIVDSKPRQLSEADMETLRDIGAMVSDELATMRLASIDDLTGISNRRAFKMLGDQALKTAHRHGQETSLLMIDLDGFKAINDDLGHETGDQALREFAEIMHVVFRESDILGRLGGDEFCVLLTETDTVHAAGAVDRFVEAVERRNVLPGRRYRLEFSVGIVQFDAMRHSNTTDMLRDADALMYQRKRAKSEPPQRAAAG